MVTLFLQRDFYLSLLLGYALGSIPFGLILTRLFKAGDLRAIGSGNIGATNVLRTGRKSLAAATLLLDALKGTLAVILAGWAFGPELGPTAGMVAGVGAVLGHMFPVWLKFQGGKGVATFLGVLLAFDWRAGLVFIFVWLACAALTRYSSLSALLACCAAPLSLFFFNEPDYGYVSAGLAALIIFRHWENIARLRAGTESRIGRKGDGP